jgi:hypothetical protein
MNYYQAREKIDTDGNPTGIYHYTCRNDNRIFPVGYCSDMRTCPVCNGRAWHTTEHCDTCDNKGYVKVAPCLGHATPEEAEAHYREYQLDTSDYSREMMNQQQRCRVCNNWTSRFASLGDGPGRIFVLCDQHCNRESLATLVGLPGIMFGSY